MEPVSLASESAKLTSYESKLREKTYGHRNLKPETQSKLKIDDATDLSIVVPDKDKLGPDETQRIARTSIEIAQELDAELKELHVDFFPITLSDKQKLYLTLGADKLKNDADIIFREGIFSLGMYIDGFDPNLNYRAQLNFREKEIDGKTGIVVSVDSISKGGSAEWQSRHAVEMYKTHNFEPDGALEEAKRELEQISSANLKMAQIEKEMGIGFRELELLLAFSFARAIGAKGIMAVDDSEITTRKYYQSRGYDVPYFPLDWIYYRYGFKPPSNEDSTFWVNTNPERLDPKMDLDKAIRGYARTNKEAPAQYRDFPQIVPQEIVQKILIPFEQKITQALALKNNAQTS